MTAKIDLRDEQTKSTDPVLLQVHLQQLVGEPFLHFRLSYGEELCLHFGQPREYTSPRLRHLVKGSYILATRASGWVLRSSVPAVGTRCSGDEDWKAVMTSELIQPGSIVSVATAQQATAVGFILSLAMSDGASFQITPQSILSGESEHDLADWELSTPHERLLQVGPGLEWSYLSTRRKSSPHSV
jgi:hypothetical protein